MLSNQFIVGQLNDPSMVLFISCHGSSGTTGAGAQSKLKERRKKTVSLRSRFGPPFSDLLLYHGIHRRNTTQTQCLVFATLFLLLSSFSLSLSLAQLFALHRYTADAICSRLTCYQMMLCVFHRFARLFYSCRRYRCCDDLAV